MKMKIIAIASLLFAGAANADVTGLWASEKSEAGAWIEVQIAACEDKTCGTIAAAHENEKPANIGMVMIKDMVQNGPDQFTGGQIYAPDTEKWYKSKMELNDDGTLKVAGCVLGGLICRSQTWTRID